jgi:hypothetical protein
VYINDVPQVLGVDYVVDPYIAGEPRTVTLTQVPAENEVILVSVRTMAQYFVSNDSLIFRPAQGLMPQAGDVITIITWHDTAEQDILTQVFVGPETQGVVLQQSYDAAAFDEATQSFESGSFDYSVGDVIQSNRFDTKRVIVDKNRLMVSVNGHSLFENYGYTVDGSVIIINGEVISNNSVVVITTFTPKTVPVANSFRVFQDMRGRQTSYEMTPESTTYLVNALAATDDVIYVRDASKLTEPNMHNGIFGLITIDGERIAYRYRDLATNTVYGLRRGTAGTGAADHNVGTNVYDIGVGNSIDIGNMPDLLITLGTYPDLF